MDDLLKLRRTIASNVNTEPEDVLRTKSALTALGDYKSPQWGLTDIPDGPLFEAVKSFQKRNGLRVDGQMDPGGPTERTVNRALAATKPLLPGGETRKRPRGFSLFDGVGENQRNRPSDVFAAKRALAWAGHYPAAKTRSFDGSPDADFAEGLRRFQVDNGLAVDGWMAAEGPTVRTLDAAIAPKIAAHLRSEDDKKLEPPEDPKEPTENPDEPPKEPGPGDDDKPKEDPCAEIRETVEGIETEIEEVSAEVEEAEARIPELDSRIRELNKKIEEKEEWLKALEGYRLGTRSPIHSMAGAAIDIQFQNATVDLKQLRIEHHQARFEKRNLEKKLPGLKQRLNKLRYDVLQWRHRLNVCEAEGKRSVQRQFSNEINGGAWIETKESINSTRSASRLLRRSAGSCGISTPARRALSAQ